MSLAIVGAKPWKVRRKRQEPERNLHDVVADYLDWCLPPTAYWFPVPNGAHMGARHAAMMKRTGQLKNGVPDICIVYLRRAIFIELKAPKGVLTEEQSKAHGQIVLAGGVVTVCRSVAQVVDFLTMLQVPLKARPI